MCQKRLQPEQLILCNSLWHYISIIILSSQKGSGALSRVLQQIRPHTSGVMAEQFIFPSSFFFFCIPSHKLSPAVRKGREEKKTDFAVQRCCQRTGFSARRVPPAEPPFHIRRRHRPATGATVFRLKYLTSTGVMEGRRSPCTISWNSCSALLRHESDSVARCSALSRGFSNCNVFFFFKK